jgi:hypothetical protein
VKVVLGLVDSVMALEWEAKVAKVAVVLDSAMVPKWYKWGVKAVWVAKVAVVLEWGVRAVWVAKVMVDRGQQPTHLLTTIRT